MGQKEKSMARRKPPAIPDALLNQLLAGADLKSAFDPNGLLDSLKKAWAERALNAEMDHHLASDEATGNGRNRRLAGPAAGAGVPAGLPRGHPGGVPGGLGPD